MLLSVAFLFFDALGPALLLLLLQPLDDSSPVKSGTSANLLLRERERVSDASIDVVNK